MSKRRKVAGEVEEEVEVEKKEEGGKGGAGAGRGGATHAFSLSISSGVYLEQQEVRSASDNSLGVSAPPAPL